MISAKIHSYIQTYLSAPWQNRRIDRHMASRQCELAGGVSSLQPKRSGSCTHGTRKAFPLYVAFDAIWNTHMAQMVAKNEPRDMYIQMLIANIRFI